MFQYMRKKYGSSVMHLRHSASCWSSLRRPIYSNNDCNSRPKPQTVKATDKNATVTNPDTAHLTGMIRRFRGFPDRIP